MRNEQSERRTLGCHALMHAENELKTHYLLGGLDQQLVLSHFAAVLYGDWPDDDTNPSRLLTAVFELVNFDKMAPKPSEQCYDLNEDKEIDTPMTKAQLLRRCVEALEAFAGRAYQREVRSTSGAELPQMTANVDGSITISPAIDAAIDDAYSHVVRPEKVSPELRQLTIDHWARRQSTWSKQTETIDVHTGHPLWSLAAAKVTVAISEGAFLVPFSAMPSRQQQFWLQVANGFQHKTNLT